MSIHVLTTIVIAVLGGGGIGALITALSTRNKDNSEVIISNIETAVKLRDSAMEQYDNVEAKLKDAERLLQEISAELKIHKKYIDELSRILDEHGIPYPDKEEFVESDGTRDGIE